MIAGIEYLGADSVVTCIVGGEMLAVRAKGKLRGGAGDRLLLAWDDSAMHCFERDSGMRLDGTVI